VYKRQLPETGQALAEVVNQIDAQCSVFTEPVVPASGQGSEGTVYAVTVNWACPEGADEQPQATWMSEVLWRPTLAEAGNALAELLNQISVSCEVDVQPLVATAGPGPEGPVYAFAVAWGCHPNRPDIGDGVWTGSLLWYSLLSDAAVALAEELNTIPNSCFVDVDPVTATGGAGADGSVYAYAIIAACAGSTAMADPGPAGGTVLGVTMTEFSFTPTLLSMSSNEIVELVLENVGAAPHNFTIDDFALSADLQPQQELVFTLEALPGVYEFYCNVPGHREAGMVGTFIVN
jgi:uncharacterized cupredoxin-like copper-binding protein